MKTKNIFASKTLNKVEQKAARKSSLLDRMISSSSAYMSNYAMLRGNQPSLTNSFFQA